MIRDGSLHSISHNNVTDSIATNITCYNEYQFTINDKDEFLPVLEFGVAKKLTLLMKLSKSFVPGKANVSSNDAIFQSKAA